MHFALPNFPQTQPTNPKSRQVSKSAPPSVSPPTITTHIHRWRCSVDRASPSTNRKAQPSVCHIALHRLVIFSAAATARRCPPL